MSGKLHFPSKLPNLTPIKSNIPCENLGDALIILQFIYQFSTILQTSNYFPPLDFPNGFTLDVLERALLETEPTGPLFNLLKMLLSTLFKCQTEDPVEFKRVTLYKYHRVDIDLRKASKLASEAARWSVRTYGIPLEQLPLTPQTISEVLRLHILGSGALTKKPYRNRGDYRSEEDPGLYFRLREFRILRALAHENVTDLAIDAKIKLINCLVNQLLTHVEFRKFIEENILKERELRADLQNARAAKRELLEEFEAKRRAIEERFGGDGVEMFSELVELYEERDFQVLQFEHLNGNGVDCEIETLVGCDRHFRQYYKLESVPGLVVEEVPLHLETNTGRKVPRKRSRKRSRKRLAKRLKENVDPNSQNLAPIKSENRWSFVPDERSFDELAGSLNKDALREGELRQVLLDDRNCFLELIKKTPVGNLVASAPHLPPNSPHWKPKYELHNLLVQNIRDLEAKLFALGFGIEKSWEKRRARWRQSLQKLIYSPDGAQNVNFPAINQLFKVSNVPDFARINKLIDIGDFLPKDATVIEPDPNVKILVAALMQLVETIEPEFSSLHQPINSTPNCYVKRIVFYKWIRSLYISTSYSQVFLHYLTLESSIFWDKLEEQWVVKERRKCPGPRPRYSDSDYI